MQKTTRNWIIAAVVFVILMLVIVFAMKAKAQAPALGIVNTPPSSTNNILAQVGSFLSGLFGKKNVTNKSSYVQVAPIDSNGCDANGYDAIGVKCDIGY